jgi:phosphoserine phosphatase RsbU/P
MAASWDREGRCVATLTEYLNRESLQSLQDAFASALPVALRICDADGAPLTDASSQADATDSGEAQLLGEAPIVIDSEIVGRVETTDGSTPPGSGRALRLAADMIGRLCEQRQLLRARVGELATLYRLAAEFSGGQDLQDVLDLVTRTVVQVLKAKACTIRLLNQERGELVIQAVAGLSVEYLNKGPILLSESVIDREVIETLKPVFIADLRSDPRVLYPAEADHEGIVSGLCAPLVYKGRPEGVIRVYTSDKREFDWFEASLLQAIASNAASAIVNARLHEEAVHAAEMQRQLRLAGVVQRQMIPRETPKVPGFDIGAAYVPCFELGGDFYDFIELPEHNLGIAICDVIGKGVRASLLMASIRASLRAHASETYEMSEVLAKVNEVLSADSLSSDFATLFYSVLDLRSRRLTYANAGHTPPLLFRDGQVCHLTTGGGVVGVSEFSEWKQESMVFHSGDVLLAYTDGLSEAMDFEDEAFGRERVEKAALEAISQGYSAEAIIRHVLWQMRRFAGLQTRLDDLTLVAIKAL